MGRIHLAAWVAVLLATRILATPPDSTALLNPRQGLFDEQWMIMQLGDERVGYAHSTMSREADEIRTRTVTVFGIARAGQKVEISILQSTRETLAGRPLQFDHATKMGAFESRTRGTITADDELIMIMSQFGNDMEDKTTYPKDAKMAWGAYRETIQRGFEPGTTYAIDVFEPALSTLKPVHAEFEIGERETIDVLGQSRSASRVMTRMSTAQGQIESVGYVDEKGAPIKVETQMAGFKMTLFATDKETALKEFEPPEFLVDTLVEVDRSINRSAAQEIDYTLRVTGKHQTLPELPATSMQQPGERDRQSAKLTVRRIATDALKKLDASAAPDELAEFVLATPTLNTKDPAIVEMAAQAAGDETRPYHLADKLRRFVTETVDEKNLNVGFATASEVCRHKEGDCTEHAVLLAALGRSRGLPSRVVVGLAYVPGFGGKQNVFGFHMWTQFHMGGQWVDFDAALRESDCSPGRIALATSSLKDAGLGDLAFAIIDVISGLEIKIDRVSP